MRVYFQQVVDNKEPNSKVSSIHITPIQVNKLEEEKRLAFASAGITYLVFN